jgi:ADP-ribose pyrophosphatase
MSSPKFTKIGERILYRGSMLTFGTGTFEAPDGQRFERDLVHHPGAVVMVPYDERTGEVVFVRQYRAPLDKELLEVPAGKRDVDGEPPEVTAVRELAEETGLEAGRLELIGHFYNSPGFSDEESWCYLARDLHEVPDGRHGVEEQHMTVERVALGKVGGLVRSGEIVDAKTIAGLFLAEEALS